MKSKIISRNLKARIRKSKRDLDKNLMNKILKIDFESVKMSSKGNFDIILKKKSD